LEAKLQKPSVPVLLREFYEQEIEVAYNYGMPGIRIQYIPGPVWGKDNAQLKAQIINGNNPLTDKPVMNEIVEKFTKALTDKEKNPGELKHDPPPATYTGTHAELQKLFLEKRYTDFMPVILPTKELVDEMLAGTSHDPDEVLGQMNPGSEAGERWSYTVKTAAINAVMAGAKPEYFPVILAIGSTGTPAVNISDNGFAAGAVINGNIRDEIGLNYDIGAIGPFAHANTTIGRAWSLLSINGGNCGKIGTTYTGTVGNPTNAINIIIAENEEQSPWEPFAVRRSNAGGGFARPGAPPPAKYKKGDNVVTLLMGWGLLSAVNWKANDWTELPNYALAIKNIFNQQGTMFGTFAVLGPNVANNIASAGYDTAEKLTKFVTDPGEAAPKAAPGGPGGPGGFRMPANFNVVVTGSNNNNYWMIGGMVPAASVKIDDWR
jgi:hypothetical protein